MKGKFPSDLTNLRFGRLAVIKMVEKNRWLCVCDCGNEKTIYRNNLVGNQTRSCGCYQKEKVMTHGLSRNRLYSIWCDIKKRCTNERSKVFGNYGGRNIKICEEWMNDFSKFHKWSITNGYKDNLSIDRKDNDGNYEPSNCRWVTSEVQNNNTRKNVRVEIEGVTRTLSQWSKLSGVNERTISHRFKNGITGKALLKETNYKRK